NAARPCGDFRSSVMLRLLRCRFWKSAFDRGPPGPSPFSRCGGVSILMTLAPQSASWRTQVGPDRTRVKSRTVKRERAEEALGSGITRTPECLPGPGLGFRPDIPRSMWACLLHRQLSLTGGKRQPGKAEKGFYSSYRAAICVYAVKRPRAPVI